MLVSILTIVYKKITYNLQFHTENILFELYIIFVDINIYIISYVITIRENIIYYFLNYNLQSHKTHEFLEFTFLIFLPINICTTKSINTDGVVIQGYGFVGLATCQTLPNLAKPCHFPSCIVLYLYFYQSQSCVCNRLRWSQQVATRQCIS